MSVSVLQAIQRVQSRYSKGVQSDDTRLSSRHIYSKLLDARATLLTQTANKLQMISTFVYQTLPCVEMIEAPLNECTNIPSLGIILKSRFPLPNIIASNDKLLVESLTVVDGSKNITFVNWDKVKYIKANKYTGNQPRAFIRTTNGDNYLFLSTKTSYEALTLTAVFEDPIEARIFPSFCSTIGTQGCISYPEMDFPIEADMLNTAVEMIIDRLGIKSFSEESQDLSNNTQDNAGIQNR